MLPGFRFLFAAIMLSMSLLVFGLGAAALLRAAHESFASNSSWRGAPEVTFAQRPETTLPVLATLRVDTNAIDTNAIDKATTDKPVDQAKVGAATADQPPAPTEPTTSGQVAPSRSTETTATETLTNEATKPDGALVKLPVAENPPVPPTAEVPTETKIAAIAASDTPPANNSEPAIAPSTNPTMANSTTANSTTAAAAVTAETGSAATKIATLGGPPVDITDTSAETWSAKADRAQADPSVVKRREQTRRSTRRRRLAARARLLAQQQLQANPFGQQLLTSAAQPRQ